ncbi:MAG: ATPase, partial [Oscillospiraceae bacterium]|nr:ATPase [Oscillospiraceae bacterium]
MDNSTYLGIELGSTRIKAVLTDDRGVCLASGSHRWENRLENGVWTYGLEAVRQGLQDCYKRLSSEVQARYGREIKTVGAIGISAMMHGYLPFDRAGEL